MKNFLLAFLLITTMHVTQMTALSATISSTNPTCAGGNPGSANGGLATITVSDIMDGTPPYAATITATIDSFLTQTQKATSATQTGFVFSLNVGPQGMASTTYNVTVTDSATPPSTPVHKSVTLMQQILLQLRAPEITNVSCPGVSNGAIAVQTAVVTPPLVITAYSITNVATGAMVTQSTSRFFSNLPAGVYSIQVVAEDPSTSPATIYCAFTLGQITEPAPSTNSLFAFLQSKYCTSCIQVPTT